jgi:hypothetical protein
MGSFQEKFYFVLLRIEAVMGRYLVNSVVLTANAALSPYRKNGFEFLDAHHRHLATCKLY